jgi:hypothetical protein
MPCSNIYSGEAPFSEMEVAGLRDLIERQIPDLKLYISLHSYGQVFLAPWGYTHEKPKNYQDQVCRFYVGMDSRIKLIVIESGRE